MIKVCIIPGKEVFPKRGGVREHLIQLYKFLQRRENISLVSQPSQADILHVESAWPIPGIKKPSVYVCHGGFRPTPIPTVVNNLRNAEFIISVADWLIEDYFPEYKWKTATIANGVDLAEFNTLRKGVSGFMPGYVLYAKEVNYYMNDFFELVDWLPNTRFVTTYWPTERLIPHNVSYIGLQSRERMKEILFDAAALLLTGSEVCPTMLLEAWACSVPVIAKNMHGNAEIMSPFQSNRIIGGCLYSDVECAANYVTDYIMEGLSSKAGLEGRQRVERMYQWDNLIDKYIAVYEHILEIA